MMLSYIGPGLPLGFVHIIKAAVQHNIPEALKGGAIRPSENPQGLIFERPMESAFPSCHASVPAHHQTIG
jgi:hypothetical protein